MNDDDNSQSSPSSTNTDDDYIPPNCNTHRTCSRYAPCNNKNHQHLCNDSTDTICRLNEKQPVKGDIRSIVNEPEHQQKYDGLKWRRICSEVDCSTYLNGGIFHETWLCRKHYLLRFPNNSSNTFKTLKKTSRRKLSIQLSNEDLNFPKRGDIRINNYNIRQKYNGKVWRHICNYIDCKSYIVTNGYCHRHNLLTRQINSEILLSLDDIPQANIQSKSSLTKSISTPNKGDIQLIRRRWNGMKWYPLCNYHTQTCTRRSSGIKYGHLCDKHYKESLENIKEFNTSLSLSPTLKRKRSVNYDSIHSSNSTPSQSTIDRIQQQTERCVQTDLTYPLESNDLRQGCFLIDDNNDNSNDLFRCESPQITAYVKKEEEISANNKRKYFDDNNSLSFNCKLEITKLEF